jgi:hypothetical protein
VNEIERARISMMARSSNAPSMGRIQKRKTNFLQIIIFGLQRAAGFIFFSASKISGWGFFYFFSESEQTQSQIG